MHLPIERTRMPAVETPAYPANVSTVPGRRQPMGGLIQGTDGAFYGTTKFGGLKNSGAVFRLDDSGNLTVLKLNP